MMLNVRWIWVVLVLGIVGPVRAEIHRIFTDKPFEDAKVAAAEQKRILIAISVAKDQPGLGLHVPTWTHEELAAWLQANAIVVKVDVEGQAPLAEELGMSGCGEVVAFNPQGLEVDRLAEDVNTAAVGLFLEGVKAGRTRIDRFMAEVAQAEARGEPDAFLRLDLAQALVADERLAEALPHYLWLWREGAALDPAFAAERFDLLVDDMIYLVDEHPPAIDGFRILRDEAAERLRGAEKTWADFHDWITLNDILDDTAATIQWWDKFKDHNAAAPVIEKHVDLLEYALIEHGRWSELLQLYPDAMAVVKGARHDLEQSMKNARQWGGEPEEVSELYMDHLRDRAATMYAALLAAGRDADAQAIMNEVFAVDDTIQTRAMLVEYALEARQPQPVHRQWLKDVGPGSEWAELKAKLDAALAAAVF